MECWTIVPKGEGNLIARVGATEPATIGLTIFSDERAARDALKKLAKKDMEVVRLSLVIQAS